MWIGERYDTKDLPSLAGALSQVTARVRIGAAVTHTGLRHPMVLASMGQTLQALSGGRFLLGLGRSARWRWRNYGFRPPRWPRSVTRPRSCAGSGRARPSATRGRPAGSPELRLTQRVDGRRPPLLLAAVGPKTLRPGRTILRRRDPASVPHADAVGRSVRTVRGAAVEAGRDVARLRCYATVVVAPDRSAEDTDLAVRARAAGYFQVTGLGDALVAANGWDPADLARYRRHPKLVAIGDGRPTRSCPAGNWSR